MWKDGNFLVYWNNGKATRIDVAWGHQSAADISQSSARQCKWEELDQTTIGRDHYTIMCVIGIEAEQCMKQNIPRWKFKTLDYVRNGKLYRANWQGKQDNEWNPL